MKRDWDLLREQLLAIEADQDFETVVLGSVPEMPKWEDGQTEEAYLKLLAEYRKNATQVFGHLELLVDGGFVDGLTIYRSSGDFDYRLTDLRLTMAGHDLLNHMRSQDLWEKTKSLAISKGVELTVESVKTLWTIVVKSVLGS